ncbi:hypothetical protein QBC46DRAFT_370859 [Diplogelasinospora grovesii]|uniref:Glycosyltransferase family 32 protein n=1 Tax=Diplogelasinospora grovesii TaxID=303347 RepID=A0AAN6NGT1_9PEZI|nr:hypothetical protein QBC46DRAFT_370859 [Diplogelasinospora grovesii]
MVARGAYRLFTLVSALVLLYLLFPYLYHFGDYVRQTNPFSGQKYIEQAFVANETELACLRGHQTIPGDDRRDDPEESSFGGGPPSDPIPNVVHFIYGLKNPLYHPDAGRFDFLSYLAVRSAVVSLKPKAIYLHYTYLSDPPSPDTNADPMTNPWVRRLAKDITLVHHQPPSGESSTQYAHLSDTMRLQFLLEQGGIYLDIDAFALRSFDKLLRVPRPHDVVLGAEGGNRWGLCNAVIAARANSTFVARWLASYDDVDLSREWNYHSVLLPKEMAETHPREVCALAPDAFFWPTWTWRHVDWMHEPLSRDAAIFWQSEIDRHGGSLFENQLAYHAWNQMAWDRYLKMLTPEVIRAQDTRFNLLMRRFLEDDLYTTQVNKRIIYSTNGS